MFPSLPEVFSSLINQVPIDGRLIIFPLKEQVLSPELSGPPFAAMFNPDSITEGVKFSYDDKKPQGQSGAEQKFIDVDAAGINLELLIDGTGASGVKKEVKLEIEKFKKTVQLKGELHRPSFLLIVYGTFAKLCVLNSYDVQYTMFRKDGTPLRAKISLSLSEHTTKVLTLLKSAFQSPDLTRRHRVVEGNTLPNLADAIYDSPRFYIEVARANNMTSFRRLSPGQELVFPPVEK